MISSEWQYNTNCNVPESCQIPRGLKRVAAILSYNGKDFCGFQKQNHSPSLQEQIEKAFSYVNLYKTLHEKVCIQINLSYFNFIILM